ncbi:MAG: response regulator [Kiritimatiellia bacterium]|jgi:PAS domain S-box-containing protein|nr:response regulator [Kiritimatiellia bacterium]MDP6810831.1 response regulator [Kiritimatiellia bacterium]MDP7024173.1 response regulator [Kiritimatiellia bacterium]
MQAPAEQDRPIVVIVTDDVTQRRILAGLLAKAELDVKSFDSAEAILDALAAGLTPRLIVTDLYMPGIDGWQLCRLLRSAEYASTNQTPILVVSATFSGEEPDRITADLGANAFLAQPVDPEQLLGTVGALLRNEVPANEPRVLIVEDEAVTARLLADAFKAQGYHVDTALTGVQALARLNQKGSGEAYASAGHATRPPAPYHIAAVDYHLPDMDGDELLKLLRRSFPSCAVVMITGDTNSELALEWMKEGAAAYARKPFHPKHLVELCEKAHRERALLYAEHSLEERTRDLRKSEAFDAALFDYSPAETIVVDTEGCIVRWNRARDESGGHQPTAGERMYVDYAGRYETDMRAALMACIGTGQSRSFPEQVCDGRALSIKIVPFPSDDPQGALIISEDITERREMEAQVRQSQKLESIGTLAAGVAHEINNPMNGIMNYAQLIKDRSGERSPRTSEFADEIISETGRVARIVRNLLAFARPEKGPRVSVKAGEILDDALSLIGAVLRQDQIRVDVDIPETLPELHCHSQQIEQVLMNLLMNARDALNEKCDRSSAEKLISVSAGPFKGCSVEGLGQVEGIRFSVEDNGTGIRDDVRARLFDPFFTTKARGKGTGLGLSIIHGIVEDHGGQIGVESEEGKWARFDVDLPCSCPG